MKKHLICYPTIVLLLLFASLTHAKSFVVPGDAPTISGCIAETEDFDTILVLAGTYAENIDLSGRTITIMSERGPAETILQPSDISSPIITIINLETKATHFPEIIGFTITGSVNSHAIFIDGSSEPLIRDNIFCENVGEIVYDKAVITCQGQFSAPVIERNRFYKNNGIACVWVIEGLALIMNNTLDSNRAGIISGGIPTVKNNIIVNSIGTGMDGTFTFNDYNNIFGNGTDYG